MNQKLNRMSYLADILIKYTTTEPRLTGEDIAIVLAEELEEIDFKAFLKEYKKQIK